MYISKVWTLLSLLWMMGRVSASLPGETDDDREGSLNASTDEYNRYVVDDGNEAFEMDSLIKPDEKGPPPPYVPNHEEFGKPSPYWPAENESSEKPPDYSLRDPAHSDMRIDVPAPGQTCSRSMCYDCRQFCRGIAIMGCYVLGCTAIMACCNQLLALRTNH